MRVLIAGGGTGGHLYPGIALAREIKRRDAKAAVTFVGTATGVEARAVPREGFPFELIRVAGLKGKSGMERLKGFATLPLAAIDAWRVVSRHRPDVVVGVGGFASGPVLMLAALRGYPTMLLEQNALPGITNRLLARVVRAAALNFDDALTFFPGSGFVAGNPVRPEFFLAQTKEADDRDVSSPQHVARVLIFGGSQGAHAINVAMVEAAAWLAAAGARLAITHQTGERDVELVRDAYRTAGLEARVEAFLFEMDREMTAADLVVARAGATTLSELAAAGRPAILVPLPTATDDHQRRNAEVIARAGAAEVIDERDLTGVGLAERIVALANDRPRQRQMADAIQRFARPDAAARIADRVWQLARSTRSARSAQARSTRSARSGQAHSTGSAHSGQGLDTSAR
ncbi:MAG TPA: undecaprenyldiphospho-muramoylpentapeptide beta-N-acetylglucosaminyltransferase [Vicinamibacterales bacterium]|nr:undecaprenyldiphospho-muramoylpentapeptide beta-N-acetylglucosaminyltransferase [Vicinamibacterales bacterium]